MQQLQQTIDNLWEQRDSLTTDTKGEARDAINETLNLLDSGKLRVAEKIAQSSDWQVNQWAKKAVLLSFRINAMREMAGGADGGIWWDKVSSKFANWRSPDFEAAGFRAVPNCTVRHSAFIAKNVVLMPSFVNLGAYVDEGAMIDTWATVGSCAQMVRMCIFQAVRALAAC